MQTDCYININWIDWLIVIKLIVQWSSDLLILWKPHQQKLQPGLARSKGCHSVESRHGVYALEGRYTGWILWFMDVVIDICRYHKLYRYMIYGYNIKIYSVGRYIIVHSVGRYM